MYFFPCSIGSRVPVNLELMGYKFKCLKCAILSSCSNIDRENSNSTSILWLKELYEKALISYFHDAHMKMYQG